GALGFDVLKSSMDVEFDPSITSIEAIEHAVGLAGMRARLWVSGRSRDAGPAWDRRARFWLVCASGLLLLCGLAWHAWSIGSLSEALGHTNSGPRGIDWPARCFYLASILLG